MGLGRKIRFQWNKTKKVKSKRGEERTRRNSSMARETRFGVVLWGGGMDVFSCAGSLSFSLLSILSFGKYLCGLNLLYHLIIYQYKCFISSTNYNLTCH